MSPTTLSALSAPSAARARLLLVALGALLALGLLAPVAPAVAPPADPPSVLTARVDTEITPVVADYVDAGIERARSADHAAFLIELDTPGGLGSSMRDIVQDILAAPLPVVVHVGPDGARAASAGAVIALAAHVTTMAPGTTIGAATPVGLG